MENAKKMTIEEAGEFAKSSAIEKPLTFIKNSLLINAAHEAAHWVCAYEMGVEVDPKIRFEMLDYGPAENITPETAICVGVTYIHNDFEKTNLNQVIYPLLAGPAMDYLTLAEGLSDSDVFSLLWDKQGTGKAYWITPETNSFGGLTAGSFGDLISVQVMSRMDDNVLFSEIKRIANILSENEKLIKIMNEIQKKISRLSRHQLEPGKRISFDIAKILEIK